MSLLTENLKQVEKALLLNLMVYHIKNKAFLCALGTFLFLEVVNEKFFIFLF